MKLEIFKESKKKKTSIIVFTICCVLLITGVFLYESFALFQVNENFNLIEGNVGSLGDIHFTYYINGEIVKNPPEKNTGYQFDAESSNCTNGATLKWNYEIWGPNVGGLTSTKTKCNVHFKQAYEESLLNGTYPILKDELIPVTIDNDGIVKKADIKEKWYSYEEKNWANAVVVKNGIVQLDGVDDYIYLGFENFDFENTITYTITMKINTLDRRQDIFCNHEISGIALLLDKNSIILSVYDEIIGDYHNFSISAEPYVNQFINITGTYDGKVLKIYINGELKGEETITLKMKPSPMPILVGANPNQNNSKDSYSNIEVKQLALYNRALTSEEIAKFQPDIKTINEEGLLKYIDYENFNIEVRDTIPESLIESYFVWIPRYRYQIFNDMLYTGITSVEENKTQRINVEFESVWKALSDGSTRGTWLTHPAFTSMDSNGMWVGKFETSKSNSNPDNSINPEGIQIKPNMVSWRSINVSNAFYTTYDYKRNLDSHMMKNQEWGAVAYLSHSKYGSEASVRFNNNSDKLTGYASVSEPTCGYSKSNIDCNRFGVDASVTNSYHSDVGFLASTTGNITGIYDMSGGSWEYVMGMMSFQDNYVVGSGSGFVGYNESGQMISQGNPLPESKYYDTYFYSNDSFQFSRRILGDATGEMGPFQYNTYEGNVRTIGSWYMDNASLIYASAPWFIRGGSYTDGSDCGLFSFGIALGKNDIATSFRVVLNLNS